MVDRTTNLDEGTDFEKSVVVFDRPQEFLAAGTPIPRAILSYSCSADYDAVVAADRRMWRWDTGALDDDYGYILRQFSCSVVYAAGVPGTPLDGSLEIQGITAGAAAISPFWPLNSFSTTHGTTLEGRHWLPENHTLPRGILVGQNLTLIGRGMVDTTGAAQPAGTVCVYADLLMYDIAQVNSWAVHSPMPMIAS